MGRLLLEKEAWLQTGSGGKHRENCCVTFTDAGSDVERADGCSYVSNCFIVCLHDEVLTEVADARLVRFYEAVMKGEKLFGRLNIRQERIHNGAGYRVISTPP